MATVTLLPGAVRMGVKAEAAPIIVGDPPQWADGSDETYATDFNTPTSGQRRDIDATLEAFTGNSATITAISWHVRIAGSTDASGVPGAGYNLYIGDTDLPDVELFATTTPTDYTGALSADAIAGVAPQLAAGAVISATASHFGTSSNSITVYEFSLEVTYADTCFVTLRPSSAVTGMPGFDAPTVSPGSAQWADDSDATYAISVNNDSSHATPVAYLPAATINAVTGFSARIRCQAITPGSLIRFGIFGPDFEADSSLDLYAVPSARGWVNVPTVTRITSDQWSALSAAGEIGASVDTFAGGSVYVYEVEVTLYFPCSIPAAPPCRLYPREDGLGVGSGRIWPPSRSQQAGRPSGYL